MAVCVCVCSTPCPLSADFCCQPASVNQAPPFLFSFSRKWPNFLTSLIIPRDERGGKSFRFFLFGGGTPSHLSGCQLMGSLQCFLSSTLDYGLKRRLKKSERLTARRNQRPFCKETTPPTSCEQQISGDRGVGGLVTGQLHAYPPSTLLLASPPKIQQKKNKKQNAEPVVFALVLRQVAFHSALWSLCQTIKLFFCFFLEKMKKIAKKNEQGR